MRRHRGGGGGRRGAFAVMAGYALNPFDPAAEDAALAAAGVA